MEFPEGLKYSKEHEWVLVEGNTATIGITEYAQEELGDIVYVELPEVGEKVVKDDPFGAVESVKAVSDVYAPVSGSGAGDQRRVAGQSGNDQRRSLRRRLDDPRRIVRHG